jgi:putative intracellular protease/amidase
VQFFNINENNFSALIIIGGSGIKNYWNDHNLHKAAQKFFKKKKIIAAICSAPVVLAKSGILNGIQSTCFPENKMELIRLGIEFTDKPVVSEKRIITAASANFSLDFVMEIDSEINQYL